MNIQKKPIPVPGYTLLEVDSIDSTNTYFKGWYQNHPDRTCLVADEQTAGRGRLDHVWKSDDDLCFSILFRKMRYRMEILTPLALIHVLRRHDIKAFIKWPNDIYVGDRKLCGILIEDVFLGSRFMAEIVGIGINMTAKKDYPSVGLRDFYPADRFTFLEEFLRELENLMTYPFEEVMKSYTHNNLIANRLITYHDVTYRVVGFSEEGYLVAQDDSGNRKLITGDDISIKQCLRSKL